MVRQAHHERNVGIGVTPFFGRASVVRAETVTVCRIAWAETCAALARRAREVAAACEILAVALGGVAFSCFENRLNKAARALGLDIAWPASA